MFEDSGSLARAVLVGIVLCPAAAGQLFPLPQTTPPRTHLENTAPFLLPQGVTQTWITDRATLLPSGLPNSFRTWDMLAVDPSSRYLVVPCEVGTGSGLFRYDMQTATFVVLMRGDGSGNRQSNPQLFVPNVGDYKQLDPATLTPWNSILTGEETTGGRLFEVQNPFGAEPYGVRWLSNVPAVAHEGLRFDAAGSLYFVDEDDSGSIYKFTPQTPGDLTVGQSFALSIDAFAASTSTRAAEPWSTPINLNASRFGPGRWVPLTDPMGVPLTVANPFAYVTVTGGRDAADEVGGTPYGRPEDIEIGRLANGNEAVYVALTSENRVLTIELLDATTVDVRVLVDFDTINLATGADVNPTQNDPLGDPGPDAQTNFDDPDNMAQDAFGGLYVVEDEEPGDVWKVFDADRDGVAEAIGMLASLGVAGTEPSGLIADPNDPYRMYICVQHPTSDNDAIWALDTNPFPGSGADLRLATGINWVPAHGPGLFVLGASAGDLVHATLSSPAGALAGAPYLLLLQPLPAGSLPLSTTPGLWIDPTAPFVSVLGGSGSALPTGGASITLPVPPAIGALEVFMQGVGVDATGVRFTDAHQVVLR